MRRVVILQLMAVLVVACSCSSVNWSNAEGRGIRPIAAVIDISEHEVNATASVADTINLSDQGANASDAINVNGSRRFDNPKNRDAGEQVTSNSQAVIWMKSLVPSQFSPTYLCTGTVIGRDTVLTSYYCVRRYSKGRLTVSEAQEILSDSYLFTDVAHMSLNEGLDLAVLKMEKEEFFTQSSVSKMIDDSDTLNTGDKCTVSGWLYGKNEWQIQNVSYMSSEDCINAYSSVASAPINETMICANPEVGNSSCMNVGWPLFCNGELVGLYSWTYLSCVHPGVYSNMKVSAPWISEATATGDASVVLNPSLTTTSVLIFYNMILVFSR